MVSQEQNSTCVHHWVIDPPEGRASIGTCKKCGTSEEFRNSFPDQGAFYSFEKKRLGKDPLPPRVEGENNIHWEKE